MPRLGSRKARLLDGMSDGTIRRAQLWRARGDKVAALSNKARVSSSLQQIHLMTFQMVTNEGSVKPLKQIVSREVGVELTLQIHRNC